MLSIIILLVLLFHSHSTKFLALQILLHEAGHIASALALSGELPKIKIHFSGIALSYTGLYKLSHKLTVTCFGPMLNILSAFLFRGNSKYCLISLGLAAVNLLPVKTLDGGELLRLMLTRSRSIGDNAKYIIEEGISAVFILLLLMACCITYFKAQTNLSLIAVTLYLTITVFGKDYI